jgi:ABC-type multidrug transport system fused ATPase/permease subunit
VEQTAGRTAIGGKLSYVPQTAFIINASLRENVLFGNRYDSARYKATITACALDSDIALLPNGDLTEIGERGINISGGQKQRISIARAAYSFDSDIVLLDDPLSAVDTHVAKHIFEKCINGLMRGRTRVLVTHSMAYVDEADQILLIEPTAVKGPMHAAALTHTPSSVGQRFSLTLPLLLPCSLCPKTRSLSSAALPRSCGRTMRRSRPSS